jgi:hypothetical protein
MSRTPERTSREWYELAVSAYVEGHQACAWCGGKHQVYRKQRASRVEYYCPACDFFAFHDPGTGQFFAATGHDVPALPQPGLASTSQTTTL